MADHQIVRPRLAFESEFGQHRNWWVRDSRVVGLPISIYLALLSHDPSRMPTQTEVQKQLGLGKDAWSSAKRRLLQAGFLIEIRDRFPDGYVDEAGRPRGGQRRFRLFLQDPPEGTDVSEHDAVFELNEPYEDYLAAVTAAAEASAARSFSTSSEFSTGYTKPLVSPTAENPHTAGNPPTAENPHTAEKPHTAENPQSFIGRENQPTNRAGGWLVGSQEISKEPTNPQGSNARDAGARGDAFSQREGVDEKLEALMPGVGMTFAAIEREVAGRVDLSAIDVVRAVQETVLRAGVRVDRPAAYVASVIVRKPEMWAHGLEDAPGPWTPPARSQSGYDWPRDTNREGLAACARGDHDWGPESWGELSRGACIRSDCGISRRTVDPAFAEFEAEYDSIGGESYGTRTEA